MKLVYFLGAGAAKPCGYLTTPELYNSIVGERPELAVFHNPLFGESLNEAAKAQPIDIEVLYELVSQDVREIVNDAYERLDPDSVSHQLVLGMLRRHSEWGDSLSQLSEAFVECRNAILEFIREKFWAIAPDCSPYKSLEITTAHNTLGDENVAIFTTNYDPSIEDFLEARVPYSRGLIGDGFEPDVLISGQLEGIRLVQLHGAIDLYRLRGGKIVRINSFQMPGPWKGDQIVGPYLVPPAMGKIAYDENQAKLLNLFTSVIKEAGALIIIGFSFRDRQVAKILSNAPGDCRIFLACGKRSTTYTGEWFSGHATVGGTSEYFPNRAITDWLTSTIAFLKTRASRG